MRYTEEQRYETLKSGFDSVQILLASPEKIESWSHGEVKNAETINYRTQRAKEGGLFDQKIFGSEKNYECACGKYRDIRYQGVVCEKCGVEVSHSSVRRTRMGHINLQTPIAHVWFLRSIPARIGTILNISHSDVQRVVYYAGYIITEVHANEIEATKKELKEEYALKSKELKGDTDAKAKLREKYQYRLKEIQSLVVGTVVNENKYHRLVLRYSSAFKAEIGGEILYNLLRKIDLKGLEAELDIQLQKSKKTDRQKIQKRLSLVRSFLRSNTKPHWMFMTKLPIIPAGIRPMIVLDGGRYATSDLNDLYRRVILRNNRLGRLISIGAPEVILRNEKRILQESVDSLFGTSTSQASSISPGTIREEKKLKSLTVYLGGKTGIFRSNLLGKRVDYSGRSVIVGGPDLKIDECGLPKRLALELFKPFVIAELLKREEAYNVPAARRLIDEGVEIVLKILEEVIADKYVLLNRQPSLHRLSIQAFRPRLIETKAISVHPLVCHAFNADFDGDAMAVHLPLTEEAQAEAREIMSSLKNIMSAGDGSVTASPNRHDMVLGCFWLTKMLKGRKGEGAVFKSTNEALTAYHYDLVDIHAAIHVLPSEKEKYGEFKGKLFETTIGRLLFNTILPSDYPFVNEHVAKKVIDRIIVNSMKLYEDDHEKLAGILDSMKKFGFFYATFSGITFSLESINIPKERALVIKDAQKKMDELQKNYNKGLISENERIRLNIELWQEARLKLTDHIQNKLNQEDGIRDMIVSGARGGIDDLNNMVGMKGIISSARGTIIEQPIVECYKRGLNPISYFTDGYGARKGLSDLALKTAYSGYFSRIMFDALQDIVITEHDCESTKGFKVSRGTSAADIKSSFSTRLKGRYTIHAITSSQGDIIVPKGGYINVAAAGKIEDDSSIIEVELRSPFQCKSIEGICQVCYGDDLSKKSLVDIGEAVGTIAAQSIGEPGTQLTMNTVHSGGAVGVEGDITDGLPRVKEIFERRIPRNSATVAHNDGMVSSITERGAFIVLTLSLKDPKTKKTQEEYQINSFRKILVKQGDEVKKGQVLTDGALDIREYFEYAGEEMTQYYIYREATHVYELQGKYPADKHFEIIVRQMFSRCIIKDPGDSLFSVGDIIEKRERDRVNKELKAKNGNLIKASSTILGITEIGISRRGFLSAASFQNTLRVLIPSILGGSVDTLSGLKENVIVGRLVPAGTGFKGSKKHEFIREIQDQLEEEEAFALEEARQKDAMESSEGEVEKIRNE